MKEITTHTLNIDHLVLNGKSYYNVPMTLHQIIGPSIEVTLGGFFIGGPEGDVVRKFRSGINTTQVHIDLPGCE